MATEFTGKAGYLLEQGTPLKKFMRKILGTAAKLETTGRATMVQVLQVQKVHQVQWAGLR